MYVFPVVITRVTSKVEEEPEEELELEVLFEEVTVTGPLGGGTVVPIPYPMPTPKAAIAIIATTTPTAALCLIRSFAMSDRAGYITPGYDSHV